MGWCCVRLGPPTRRGRECCGTSPQERLGLGGGWPLLSLRGPYSQLVCSGPGGGHPACDASLPSGQQLECGGGVAVDSVDDLLADGLVAAEEVERLCP